MKMPWCALLVGAGFISALGCSSSSSDATPTTDSGVDAPGVDAATIDSAAADSGTMDSSPTDSATADSATTDSATADSATTCGDAGVEAPSDPAHAHIVATLSAPSADFNGSTAAFDGSRLPGASVAQNGGYTLYTDSNGLSGAAQRSVLIRVAPTTLTACTVYPLNGTTSYIDYSEPMGYYAWRCAVGSVTVDAVVGKSTWFHFEGSSCSAPPAAGNAAVGTMSIQGKGTATLP
jgi:hypothetical protein